MGALNDFVDFVTARGDPANQPADPNAGQPTQAGDPNAGQPTQEGDPSAGQPAQAGDPSAGQPAQSGDPQNQTPNPFPHPQEPNASDPNAAQPATGDGSVTIPEVTVQGDANLGRAYNLGFADGQAGSPTHRAEIEQSAPGPTELLASYEDGFRDGQAKAKADADGDDGLNHKSKDREPEDDDDPHGELGWKGERGLTASERGKAQSVYQDSIDYDKVAIAGGSVGSAGSTRTIGNTIYMEREEFVGDTSELTSEGLNTLIHELGHVWQYQHGGLEYIPNALKAQAESTIGTGDRDDAYDWRRAIGQGKEWKDWNAEQQAMAMEDYFRAQQRIEAAKKAGNNPAHQDEQTVITLEPYVSKVQAGKGAPGGPSDEPGDYVPPQNGDAVPA